MTPLSHPSSSGIGATYRAPVLFDIETCGIPSAGEYIETPAAPANYKDREKIQLYVEEKTQELILRAALDPDLARVVCLSLQSGTELVSLVAKTEDEERELVKTFFALVGDGPEQAQLIGFGILSYDLRVLLRRALYLGVKAPPIQIDKYRHAGVIDLMDELSFHGAEKFHSLDFYVKRFGLGPFPEDIKGRAVPALVAVGAWTEVQQHCETDVAKIVALAKRIGVLR
jgi:hypothetical protein